MAAALAGASGCRPARLPQPQLADRAAWMRPASAAPSRRCCRRLPPSAARAAAAAPGSECHFQVLGLPRTASLEDVKAAYRRLVRQWHPDVNPAPEAAERLQAVMLAFEVLSDAARRRQYERAEGPPGSSRSRRGGQAPADVQAMLQLEFREAALGAQRTVEVLVLDACLHCGGSGAQPGSRAPPCTMCRGRREIVRRQGATGAPDAVVCCPICSGRGVRVAQPCSCCRGRGLARQPRQVPVRVPRGVDSGSTLRIPAEGDLSRLGGPRGAVLLELQVSPEEGIWRRGLDLHSQLAVPLWDALLGGTATVSTLRGDARLTIPPGTQHGAVLSLAQAGVQREGDGRGSCGAHHFEVVVELPRQVSSAEQELLQRLAELQRRRRRRGSGSRSAGGGG